MAAPTKAEKYCKANFNIITNETDREFHFERIDSERTGYVVSFETHPTLKDACLDVFNSDQIEDGNKPKLPLEWSERVSKVAMFMEVASKYPTDKINHGYIALYAEHLPENPKSILEIGCYRGDSIRMWREIFPDSKLATLDLFEEYGFPDVERVEFYKGSQSDTELLDVIAANNYDVVIDDGSHGARDQWLVIEKFLKPGSLVIIEDLHCNFDGNGFWNQGLPESETILGRIKSGTFNYNHEMFLDKIVFIYG